MKKTIAYSLIIISLVSFIVGGEIIESMVNETKITEVMYSSVKGIKVIISVLEAKIAGNATTIFLGIFFLFLFGAGAIILLSERIRLAEERLKELEEWKKQK